MAQFESWFRQDLQKPVQVQVLNGNVFSMDAGANIVGVEVFDGGDPVELDGSVSGYAILANGETVPLPGSVTDNKASVTVIQSALTVPGTIRIVIKWTDGTTIATLLALVSTVYRSMTDTIVTPDPSVISDWSAAIAAEIAECATARENLGGIIAAEYSTTKTYAVGEYVMKSGTLYRCTTAVTTAGSWSSNSGKFTEVKLGPDVSDLKSAFVDEAAAEFGIVDIGTPKTGYYIKKSDGRETSSSGGWSSTNGFIEIKHKAFLFTCPMHSSSLTRNAVAAMAFYTSNAISAYMAEDSVDLINGTTGDVKWIVVNVPETAKYFRASIYNVDTYKIIGIDSFPDTLQKISEIQAFLDDTKFLQSVNMVTSFGGTGDIYANLTELPDNSLCRTTNAPDRPDWIAANNGFWVLTAKAKNYNTWLQIGFAARTGDIAVRYKGTATSNYTGWIAKDSIKPVRILCIGNSFTLDNLSYMPFILKNIAPDINLTLTFAFYPSSTIDQHIAAFDNDTVTYYKCVHKAGSTAWVHAVETAVRDSTLKEILASEQWDFITFQQASGSQAIWSTYANLNTLIDKVIGYVNGLGNHSVRVGWLMPQVRAESESTYPTVMENVQKVLQTTPIDFVIPCGTAVENARGTSLQSLGDGGNLEYTDGHLQEGLPCMIGAYTATIKILELCGMAYMGIMGEGTVPTAAWLSDKNIPNPQGSSVGATTANCYIAQKCAVAAVKKPYDVTQIAE